MSEFFNKIIPIILIFFLGYFLKKIQLFRYKTADVLLKVVFYITLPSLIILSLLEVELKLAFVFFPIVAVLVMFTTYFISKSIGKKMQLASKSLGTFIISTMIINTAFVYPFIISAYGEQGFAYATIFQFGNGLIIFTFVYYLAIKYSSSNSSRIELKKFLALPPIWALLIGIILNLANVQLPLITQNLFRELGNPTIPLVMLSLGIYFNFRIKNIKKIIIANIIRIGTGLLLSIIFADLLNFTGLRRSVLIICSAAPIGYNTLVFSSIEKLDKKLAANLVSSSLLIGIIYIPILIFLL